MPRKYINQQILTLLFSVLIICACGKSEAPSSVVEGPIETVGNDLPPGEKFVPEYPTDRSGTNVNVKEYGDIMRTERASEKSSVDKKSPEGAASFHESLSQIIFDDPALTSVTREYGPTIISMKELPIKTETVIASPVPWSSWWFPRGENYLFNDTPGNRSTLSKYDLVRGNIKVALFSSNGSTLGQIAENITSSNAPSPVITGSPTPPRNELDDGITFSASIDSLVPLASPSSITSVRAVQGSAAAYERENFNSGALRWEGLCDAWSLAAISKPEPKRPVSVSFRGGSSLTFKVSDLKALLFKTYEAVETKGIKYFGQRFTGNENGWIHPDIFPDQFHRFIEVQLMHDKKPFVMDHDSGVEVWNVPVFKGKTLIDQIPGDANAVFVRTWLATAESPSVNEKEFLGTKEVLREYNYVLKGTRNERGELIVNSGYWVKGPSGIDSRRDHPDYFLQIPDPSQLIRRSWNPEIDVDVVDRILEKSY